MKVLVFDRDGTLIRHVPYLGDPAQVELLPGARELIATAKRAGCMLVLHTNQSGVGRGHFSMAEVRACNERLAELLGDQAIFDRIVVAPEAPGQSSRYRKPTAALVDELVAAGIAERRDIAYIGDRWSDLACAKLAQTHGYGVNTGLEDLHRELAEHGLAGSYPVFDCLEQLRKHLFVW